MSRHTHTHTHPPARPPTRRHRHSQTHITTHSRINSLYKSNHVSGSEMAIKQKDLRKSNFLVRLPPISPQPNLGHLSFHRSACSSTLTSLTLLLGSEPVWGFSLSFITVGKSTCFEFDTCQPHQARSQQVAVNSVQALRPRIQQTHTHTQPRSPSDS